MEINLQRIEDSCLNLIEHWLDMKRVSQFSSHPVPCSLSLFYFTFFAFYLVSIFIHHVIKIITKYIDNFQNYVIIMHLYNITSNNVQVDVTHLKRIKHTYGFPFLACC